MPRTSAHTNDRIAEEFQKLSRRLDGIGELIGSHENTMHLVIAQVREEMKALQAEAVEFMTAATVAATRHKPKTARPKDLKPVSFTPPTSVTREEAANFANRVFTKS